MDLDMVAGRLAGLPGVRAVSLGGSRAQGTHRQDSDWDLAVYYQGGFDPQSLRDLGWPGEVSELGAWSDGVFNGGAWLTIDGAPVDVHYRDLDVVTNEIAQARAGRFRVEQLLFHLAGIPSYLVVGELAINRVLRGELPRPEYPAALRANAPAVWWRFADAVFGYARVNHAPYGRVAQCAGLVAQAATQAAHAVQAGRGEWVTNEKTLLTSAGLDGVNDVVAAMTPELLGTAVDTARELCLTAVDTLTA